jgi:hypothetical protein
MTANLSIGQYSRATYLSLKALRHYHDNVDRTYGSLGRHVAEHPGRDLRRLRATHRQSVVRHGAMSRQSGHHQTAREVSSD